MTNVVDHPPILLATAVVALCGAAFLGDLLRSRVRPVKTDERADLDIVLTATLTLLGYRERRRDAVVLTVLPLVVSIALFLIADIDSPREGLIRVAPINLVQLSDSMHAQD